MNVGLVVGLIISIVVLIAFSAVFSCADMAFAVVNQLKLKKEAENGSKTCARILKFAENYDTTITTVLFSNNLVNIAAASLATILGFQLFPGEDWSATVMSIILVLVLLIFGEVIPKVAGRDRSYSACKLLIYPISFFRIIFFPFVWVAQMIGKLFLLPFKKHRNSADDKVVSDDELQEMVDTIEKEGVIDEDQGELLRSAIDFKETEAFEIMTPRIDVFAIDIADDIHKLMKNDEIFMHTRIPVYNGTIDNIIGILSTKVLLKRILANQEINVASLIDSVHFVPRSMGISEILKNMKKTRNHIVIVKDEYGGVEGLLTMEDILEELVGDIWDEMDEVKEPYTKIKKGQYEVDGSMNIEDFFELVGAECPEEKDYATVGGWCVDVLQRFAKTGDTFKFENLRIKIIDTTEFTVEKISVRILKKKDA